MKLDTKLLLFDFVCASIAAFLLYLVLSFGVDSVYDDDYDYHHERTFVPEVQL